MNEEEIEILRRSGLINNKAQKLAQKITRPGISFMELGTKIEAFIRDAGAVPAWPVNLSVNEQAAHNSYSPEEITRINEADVLKVDIGVSIDGYITDSSQTFVFSKENEKLREASIQALLSAKGYILENPKTAKISELGKLIEEKIKSYGYSSISNLTGHTINRYTAHDYPSIPNVANNSNIFLKDIGSWFAVEPFASTGKGYVTEGAQIYIFRFEEEHPIRNQSARMLLEEIKAFNGLAFSEYWVGKNMSPFDRKIGIRELLKSGIIAAYPVLVEKPGVLISQAETTFLVTENQAIDLVEIDELLK